MSAIGKPEIITKAFALESGPLFQGLPVRWLENATWRCAKGHVSKRYLKSEVLGMGVCLACLGQLWLTFPEDVEQSPSEALPTSGGKALP